MCLVLALRPWSTHPGYLLIHVFLARALLDPICTMFGEMTKGNIPELVGVEVQGPASASLPTGPLPNLAEVDFKPPVLILATPHQNRWSSDTTQPIGLWLSSARSCQPFPAPFLAWCGKHHKLGTRGSRPPEWRTSSKPPGPWRQRSTARAWLKLEGLSQNSSFGKRR